MYSLYTKLVTYLIFYHFIIFTINASRTCRFYIGFGGTHNASTLICEPDTLTSSLG